MSFQFELISRDELLAELPNLYLRYPYYEIKNITKAEKLGLKNRKCVVEPQYRSKLIALTFEDGEYLVGNKKTFEDDFSIDLGKINTGLLEIVKEKSQFIFLGCFETELIDGTGQIEPNNSSLKIFDLYHKYERVYVDAIMFNELKEYWPVILYEGKFNLQEIHNLVDRRIQKLVIRFKVPQHTCRFIRTTEALAELGIHSAP